MKSKKSQRVKTRPSGRRLINCFIRTHSRSTSCRHPSWSRILQPCGWRPMLDPCNGPILPLSNTTWSIMAFLRAWDRVNPVTPAPITTTLKDFVGPGVFIAWYLHSHRLLAHCNYGIELRVKGISVVVGFLVLRKPWPTTSRLVKNVLKAV